MAFKEEFLLWQQSEITAELKNNINDQIANLAAEIVNRDAPSGDRDMFVRGVIKGLVSVLEWKPTFVEVELEEEEQDDDEI